MGLLDGLGWGGGGNTTTTNNVSGLPDEFKPFVTDALQSAQDAHKAGALSEVQGLTNEQNSAFNRKLELGKQGGVLDQIANDSHVAQGAYRDAASGQGLFGSNALQDQASAITAGGADNPLTQAVQQAVGDGNASNALGGSLGSARAGAQTQKAAFDSASQVASQELGNRRAASLDGAQGTISSGANIQNQFGTGIRAEEGVGSALQQQGQNEKDAVTQGLQTMFGFLNGSSLGNQMKSITSGGGK